MKVAIHPGTDRSALPPEITDLVDDKRAEWEAADVLVTIGEEALIERAQAGERRPITALNLDAPVSRHIEALSSLGDVIDRLERHTVETLPTVSHRPLELSVDSTTTTAVFDCSLLTTEPARISEYVVRVDGDLLAEFRSDGVVVATPLGSGGYGRAAGGPRLAAGTGVAITPVSPFATRADDWVVTPPLRVTVERETDVTAYADSTPVASGEAGLAVGLRYADPLSLVDVPSLLR